MLISFIGSPCSGKTTVAASVFADLKASGQSAEFIPEVARIYIARKRVTLGKKPKDSLILTDEDQFSIMTQQLEMETTLIKACGRYTTIISDSSALSALFYMTEEFRASTEVQELVQKHLAHNPMVFYARPVPPSSVLDVNRIHDSNYSQKVDAEIPSLLEKYVIKSTTLTGKVNLRVSNALHFIYSELSKDI